MIEDLQIDSLQKTPHSIEIDIMNKKSELLEIIRLNLKHGDLKAVSIDENISYGYLRNAIRSNKISSRILNILHKKALDNRANPFPNFQEMIDGYKD